uniref:Uncharacterized protein n=1 Tax=Chenopodium quinoa TaxID=63459 RepID=A0A803MJ66_CHEQI
MVGRFYGSFLRSGQAEWVVLGEQQSHPRGFSPAAGGLSVAALVRSPASILRSDLFLGSWYKVSLLQAPCCIFCPVGEGEAECVVPSSPTFSSTCFEELRGMLCISHVEENDVSSHELEFMVGQLENPFGILNFVKSLKDQGNIFYKQNQMGSAIAKYSLALKIMSFASVCSDEDKLMFSNIAVSLNLNLGACFIKVKDYDKVGQLCSAVLCFDTTNLKAYFRRAIAALGLHKPTLVFMDLAQPLKLDPKNSEFQQKLKEVISLLGWSPDFVDEALAITRQNEKYIGVKDDTNMGKNVDGNSLDLEGKVNPTNQDLRPNVIDNNCDLKGTSETKNSNLTGSSFRFSSRKRYDSYLHLTPTMYGAISKGRTIQYYCSLQKNFITIRVANHVRKMDSGVTQESSTPMEFSHPPVEGHDRCETTPNLVQEDSAIDMAGQESSCEATSTLLPISPVSSLLQTSVHPTASSSEFLLGSVSSPCPRLSGSKRIASCPIEYTWFPNRKKLYGPTLNVLSLQMMMVGKVQGCAGVGEGCGLLIGVVMETHSQVARGLGKVVDFLMLHVVERGFVQPPFRVALVQTNCDVQNLQQYILN